MKSEIIVGNSHELIEGVVRSTRFPIIVTDPPFNVGYHYEGFIDREDEDTYFKNLVKIFSLCPSVVVHYPESLHRLSIAIGKAPERIVSWVYNSNTKRQHRDIAYYGIKPDFTGLGEYKNPNDKRVKKLIDMGRKPSGYDWLNVNQIKNVSLEKTEHPCQMPVEVMKYVCSTLKGVTVIDPFLGSGTTGVACAILGIDFIGIEMNAKYAEISRCRIESAKTGKEVNHGLQEGEVREEVRGEEVREEVRKEVIA